MVTLKVKLLKWQLESFLSTAKVKGLSGASDTGKSYVWRLNIIANMLRYERARAFACANTWTQTQRAVIEPMIETLEEWGLGGYYHFEKSTGILWFDNRSRVEIFPSENLYDRLRSREFAMGYLEEVSTFPEKYIEAIYALCVRSLRQRGIPDKHRNLLMATNPDLKTKYIYTNFFNDVPENGYAKQLCFKDGYNANDKERENLILMGSQRQIDLFYHGKWGSLEGQCYVLEHGKHIKDLPDVDKEDRFYITFDYGFFPDPQVYLLFTIKNGIIFVVDEIVLYSVTSSRHSAYLDTWFNDGYHIVGYTGETSAGSSEIREVLNEYGLHYYLTTKRRHVGWTTIADMLDVGQLVINPRCKHLIESLHSMVWIGNKKEVDAEGEFEDPADALRYAIMSSICVSYVKDRNYVEQHGITIG